MSPCWVSPFTKAVSDERMTFPPQLPVNKRPSSISCLNIGYFNQTVCHFIIVLPQTRLVKHRCNKKKQSCVSWCHKCNVHTCPVCLTNAVKLNEGNREKKTPKARMSTCLQCWQNVCVHVCKRVYSPFKGLPTLTPWDKNTPATLKSRSWPILSAFYYPF